MMQMVATGSVLLAAVAAGARPPCTRDIKQPALYLSYQFDPPLKVQPTYDISAETVWNSTDDMRKVGGYGIYAAHPVGFEGSAGHIGGYLGTQVVGKAPAGEVKLLFSIWDGGRAKGTTCSDDYDPALAPNATWCNKLHAFPVTNTCHRHCLDCGDNGYHNTTGVKCGGQRITIGAGDAIRTRIHRLQEKTTYTFPETPDIEYVGSVWRAEVQVVSAAGVAGELIEIGQIFFEGIDGGLNRFQAFHEHIGCAPCKTFYESEIRRGPWENGPSARPRPTITFTPPKNHPGCTMYDVTVDNEKHEAQFFSGPGMGQ